MQKIFPHRSKFAEGVQPRPGWSLDYRDPKFIERWLLLWGWLYRYYFRVQTSGWQHIPQGQKVLLVGSHNGGLASPDTVMMMYDWFKRFGTERPVYGLMHPYAWQVNAELSKVAAQMGAIEAHPKMAIAALQQGASVLVYPGGARDLFRPHSLRHQICLADNYAFIKLALREQVLIVPVISKGAHDTLVVLADIYPLIWQLRDWGLLPWIKDVDPEVFPIYLGLPWGLSVGPLPNIPLPVAMHTRICAPIVFERYGLEAARDRAYVKVCYERVRLHMQQALDQLVAETG
ncbi:MAG: glycerol acyltransferase [Leptolyngbyaceae cyanobacterium SM1_1_3]|nr:glycerol acyltransferase [Leptolyngbyaceae cyanobacterium SM1_1_3]NJN01258.1 glycerol acyltransferase [Leptolyngbyaceae cyanobacterium RM1_1_2]NJO11531.1 glycerol acyltransferase [Leptolyngbyaceae cyanobacterium SL_1_1]